MQQYINYRSKNIVKDYNVIRYTPFFNLFFHSRTNNKKNNLYFCKNKLAETLFPPDLFFLKQDEQANTVYEVKNHFKIINNSPFLHVLRLFLMYVVIMLHIFAFFSIVPSICMKYQ